VTGDFCQSSVSLFSPKLEDSLPGPCPGGPNCVCRRRARPSPTRLAQHASLGVLIGSLPLCAVAPSGFSLCVNPLGPSRVFTVLFVPLLKLLAFSSLVAIRGVADGGRVRVGDGGVAGANSGSGFRVIQTMKVAAPSESIYCLAKVAITQSKRIGARSRKQRRWSARDDPPCPRRRNLRPLRPVLIACCGRSDL